MCLADTSSGPNALDTTRAVANTTIFINRDYFFYIHDYFSDSCSFPEIAHVDTTFSRYRHLRPI